MRTAQMVTKTLTTVSLRWEAGNEGITHSPFRASAGRLSAHPEVNSGWILLTRKGFMRNSTMMPSVGSLFLALCNHLTVFRGHKDRRHFKEYLLEM